MMKAIKMKEVKKPNSVNEFRNNLRNYFWSYGGSCLYVKTESKKAFGIKYESINTLNDLYEITGDLKIEIIPNIEFSMDDFSKHQMSMKNTHPLSFEYFHDDYEVISTESDFMIQTKIHNSQWFSIDNQIIREYLQKVLGDYSGYLSTKKAA